MLPSLLFKWQIVNARSTPYTYRGQETTTGMISRTAMMHRYFNEVGCTNLPTESSIYKHWAFHTDRHTEKHIYKNEKPWGKEYR